MTQDQEDRMRDLISTLNIGVMIRKHLFPLTGEEDVTFLSETLASFLERVEHICKVELERLQDESGLEDAQMHHLAETTMNASIGRAIGASLLKAIRWMPLTKAPGCNDL
jgi:hypothetical protein